MATLRPTSNYHNKYEGAYDMYQGTSYFSKDAWDNFASKGQLVEYVTVLDGISKIPNFFTDYNAKYNFKYMDADRQFVAMQNELYGDRTEIKKYTETVYNPTAGKEETQTYEMTEYDYILHNMEQWSSWKQEELNAQSLQEAKDAMGWVAKSAATVTGALAEFAYGAGKSINDFSQFVTAVANMYFKSDYLKRGALEAFRETYEKDYGRIGIIDDFGGWLQEFESQYSYLRTVEGEYTTAGKYLGGTFYSLGMMVPSIVIGKGLAGIGVAGQIAGKIGSAQYFSSMFSGRVKERVDDPRFTTVPTADIVMEAALSTTLDYLITRGTAKILGGTIQDSLVHGITPGGVKGGILGRIVHDFVAEGTEEALQEYSQHLVSEFMAIRNESFGGSEFTFQTALDSFLLGGLSTIFMNAADIITTNKIRVGEGRAVLGKDGKPVLTKSGGVKLKYDTISKVKSWAYNANYQNLLSRYAELLDSKSSMTDTQYLTAMKQMYLVAKTMSDITAKYGDERLKKAEDLLTKMQNRVDNAINNGIILEDGTTVKDYAAAHATLIINSVDALGLSLTDAESATKIKKDAGQLSEAEMRQVIDVFNATNSDDISETSYEDGEFTANEAEKVKEILKDGTYKRVVLMQGASILAIDDTIYMPLEAVRNMPTEELFRNVAEQRIVNAFVKNIKPRIMEDIIEVYRVVTGQNKSAKITKKVVINNLLYNPTFYRIMLSTSYSDMLDVLSEIHDSAERAVVNNKNTAAYKQVLDNIRTMTRTELSTYLIYQQNAEYKDLKVLRESDKKTIANKRYYRDLANKVKSNEVLTRYDLEMLDKRVNALPIPAPDKAKLKELFRGNTLSRINGMSALDAQYNNIFFAGYDGTVYMSQTSPQNNSFNVFLQKNNLTIRTLTKDVLSKPMRDAIVNQYGQWTPANQLAYLQTKFLEISGNTYTFSFDEKGVKIEYTDEANNDRQGIPSLYARGVPDYIQDLKSPEYRRELEKGANTKVTEVLSDTKKIDEYIGDIVTGKLDRVTRGHVRINDIILDPTSCLNSKRLKEIEDEYSLKFVKAKEGDKGAINSHSTFLYLRRYFLEKSRGTVSIVLSKSGRYVFADLTQSMSLLTETTANKNLRNRELSTDLDKYPEGVPIQNYIKDKHLQGKLADILVVSGEAGHYNPVQNIIYLPKNMSNAEFKYILLHEFEHAIQEENNLITGTTTNLPVTQQMIDDIKKNVPDLFRNKKKGVTDKMLAQEFLYYTSGESMAYMNEHKDAKHYPTIISKLDNNSYKIITPWGSEYVVSMSSRGAAYDITPDALSNETEAKVLKSVKKSLPDKEGNIGYILPDGTIGYSSKFTSSEDLHAELLYYNNDGTISKENPTIAQSMRANALYERSVKIQYIDDTYVITIPDRVSTSQNNSIAIEINKLTSKNKKVVLSTVSGITKEVPADANGDKVLERFNTEIKSTESAERRQARIRAGVAQPADLLADSRARRRTIGKGNRQLAKYKHQDTNLKYYLKEYKIVQMYPALQDFIVETTGNEHKLDSALVDLIVEGKLKTLGDVTSYFRHANLNTMNDYTFNLLNKHFFKNNNIRTVNQLQTLLTTQLDAATALLRLWKNNENAELLDTRISIDNFTKLIERLTQSPVFEEKFEQSLEKISALEYVPELLRIEAMNNFDGTIRSMNKIGNYGRLLTATGRTSEAAVNLISTSSEVKGLDNTILEDTLEDTGTKDLLDQMLDDDGTSAKEKAVKEYARSRLLGMAIHKKWSQDKLKSAYDTAIDAIENYTSKQLDEKYLEARAYFTAGTHKVVQRMIKQQYDSEKVDADKENYIKNKQINNLKRVRTMLFNKIKGNFLTKKQKELLQKALNKVIDVNTGDFVVDLDKNIDSKTIVDMHNTIREVLADIRRGKYSSKSNYDLINDLDRMKQRVINERQRAANWKEKYTEEKARKPKVIIVPSAPKDFTMTSTSKLPDILSKIFETTFDVFTKSKVQFVTNEDSDMMRMTAKKFYEVNADLLNNMTLQDADNVIDFFSKAAVVDTTNEIDVRRFTAFKMYMLAYITQQANAGVWIMSKDQMNLVQEMLQGMTSTGATTLAVWRSVLDKVDPQKVILQQAIRVLGTEVDAKDIDALTAAVRTGDMKQIEKAQAAFYNKMLKQKKGEQKVMFVEKLVRFHSAMMLSNFGTVIRNQASNVFLHYGNKIADVLGNAFTGLVKKKYTTVVHTKDGQYESAQYDFRKVKVSNEIAAFIKTSIIDNNMLEFIQDGLTKYDPRIIKKVPTGADAIVSAIVNKVASKIMYHNTFDTQFLNKLTNSIFKMQSDNFWTQETTLSYFGKLLQINNIDLSQHHLSKEIMDLLAESYVMATFDYMRKPNVFTRMESELKKINPTAWAGYKLVFPYMGASWNWFLESLNWTPLGLVKSVVDLMRVEKKINDIEAKRQKGEVTHDPRFTEHLIRRRVGKGIAGSILMGLGVLLGALGRIRVDREDDNLKLAVGNLYVDISGVFGTSALLIGAQLTNPREGNWTSVLRSTFNMVADDSFVTTYMNLFRKGTDVYSLATAIPYTVVNSFIPNLIRAANRTLYNHKVKYDSGFIGDLQRLMVSAIPFSAHLLDGQVDIYTGEEIKKYPIPIVFEAVRMFSPIKLSYYNVSDEEKTAIAYGLNKGQLTGNYSDIGQVDKVKLNQIYGKLNSTDISNFINNKTAYTVLVDDKYKTLKYSQMTDEQKKNVLERIMSQNAKFSKVYMYTTTMNGKYYTNENEWNALRAAGITKNVFKGDKGFS